MIDTDRMIDDLLGEKYALESENERLRGQVEAARELKVRLEEVAGRFPASSAWWCPHCGEAECAYNGTCTKCGVRIEDNQPGDEWINSIESAITKATEAGV